MDQHPLPRQITTFEFKLVGFLTIKQFIYIVVFVAIGAIVYGIFPIPILNIFFAIIVGSIGLAFAFLPVNDRPLDVWVKNLIKRLSSPTQYKFKKQNTPPSFLLNMTLSSPSQLTTHVDSQKKLANYLGKNTDKGTSKKQSINNLFQKPLNVPQKKVTPLSPQVARPTNQPKKPFISGFVKNHNNTPLYGILIYVKKDEKSEPIRIFKTNVNGVFASFNPLEKAEYFFEIKDPMSIHFFDTMKIQVEETNPKPLEFVSKELL
ncbi:MAG: hypothetical protein UR89_C0021G0022 [Candidatus Roizmanbacteria bacterium GW2011_GWA2_35_8]|uniref:PrgI family protein n=1 Tax=Candidatus Roizmanbacteria bacterium GW2011_GWA2_35_8 TaxID=1618479 RepID=A0A0G0FGB3_9BACT|nr:MAG: hypothetical protein UR89_C0021G0022 [Candidatus Roizmanbacteria bacterium GW2011_GWA2_35_8]